ncbi:MAG: zinc ABC transporter substrate-binding protein [Candidatus Poribacteria bacterium]|nr:zinc ABC transporter substrate-binding protein [Candidatus Poribacteria bacterium]MDE0505859.1 zinc ABC transporter substrate-binding protein [Candidatus Poribacteria bacterium]
MDWRFLKTSLCLVVLLLMVASGCQKDNSEDTANASPATEKKLRVVATISMITDILENIGRDRIDVTGIVGEGVDPHLYKPTAGDVERLKDAEIIFYNGLNLEAKIIGAALDKMAYKTKAVAVTDGTLRSHLRTSSEFPGGYDPHVWHDVSLWMKAVERVRDTLAQAAPNNAEYYRTNAKNYLAALKTLHDDLQNLAAQVPDQRRILVTTHDAFGYLGRAYGLEVRGLQGLNTETEAGVADVRELAAFIIEHRIPAMFVETSAPSQGIEAVQAAVRAKGFEIEIGGSLFADAMGTPGTPEGTYIGSMHHNMNTIVNALRVELAYRSE